jgi:glutathione S-transferase
MGHQEVNVHIVTGVWGVASASPFCLKLLTWLRMHAVAYRTSVLKGPPKSSTGKVPYIDRADGSYLADSSSIIETLAQQRAIGLDEHLSEQQRVSAHLLKRTIENSLYFVVLWQRWHLHWEVTREAYFHNMPWLLRMLAAPFLRRGVLKQIRAQGIGRGDREQIFAAGCADVDAIAGALGDGEFFFGEPSSTDALVYGFLANILAARVSDPLTEAIRAHENLVDFCTRIDQRYWSDWQGRSDEESYIPDTFDGTL